MKLLESKQIIGDIYHRLKHESAHIIDGGTTPHLAVVLVGEDPDSLRYIDIKTKRGKEVGVTVSVYHLEEDATKEEIKETVSFLGGDDDVHAIIVQLPLPGNWTEQEQQELFNLIPPAKDVDGLRGDWESQSYQGMTRAELEQPHAYFLPPMVASVCLLLEKYKLTPADKKTIIVGRGKLVGQPLEAFFKKLNYEVLAVDEETDDILSKTIEADILISGTGSENLITYQWVKPDAIVLDCANDVHRDSVDQVAGYVAPSTGGLGPITVAWLLRNTVTAASILHHQQHPHSHD